MLIVSDANIFIDFEAAQLLELLFKLPYEIVVPDTLYAEELSSEHAHLIDLGLEQRPLSGKQVDQAYRMQVVYREPSLNDLFALVLAKSLDCPLATGDRRLRAAAQTEGLELLGTLSLLERLFTQSLLDVVGLQQAYQRMKAKRRRLPWDAVEEQVKRLREGVR